MLCISVPLMFLHDNRWTSSPTVPPRTSTHMFCSAIPEQGSPGSWLVPSFVQALSASWLLGRTRSAPQWLIGKLSSQRNGAIIFLGGKTWGSSIEQSLHLLFLIYFKLLCSTWPQRRTKHKAPAHNQESAWNHTALVFGGQHTDDIFRS